MGSAIDGCIDNQSLVSLSSVTVSESKSYLGYFCVFVGVLDFSLLDLYVVSTCDNTSISLRSERLHEKGRQPKFTMIWQV